MSLSDIWFLYRARLRARAVLVQEGFAIAGIAVGVALLFASQVAATSLSRSVAKMTRQIVGNTQFQLQARGPGGIPESLLRQARAVPGVRAALPVLELPANAIAPHARRSIELIGADPRFSHFAGPVLRRFSARQLAGEQSVALPSSLAEELHVGPLEVVNLQLGARVVPTIVGAVLGEADIGELSHSPVAVAPVRYVQKIAGLQGRVSRIFIGVDRGREQQAEARLRRLAAAVNANFEPADFDATLFSVAASPATQSQSVFSAISALVGFMFALNAMLMTAPSRRRLVEDVRKQGATRLMTVQLLLFDATVIGVVACALGLGLGDLLSAVVFHANPGYLSFAFPVGSQRIVTWWSIAIGICAGLAAAVLGVCWPLRDLITRPFDPAGRQGRTAKEPRVWALAGGLICLSASAVILVARPQSAIAGVFALIVALLLLLPFLFDVAIDVFERLQRPFHRTAPLLAITELRTPHTRVRSIAIAATAAIAMFGVVAIQGAQRNLEWGLSQSGRALDRSAALWVTPGGGFDAFATIPFKDSYSALLSRAPGVRHVSDYRGGFLDWGNRRLWVIAPSAAGGQVLAPSQLLVGNLDRATRQVRRGGWVVLSRGLAEQHHLAVGDPVQLPAPHPVKLRVAALSTNMGWAPGSVILSTVDYARAWASGDISAYEVQLRPGVTPVAERDLLRRELERAHVPLQVETAGERMAKHDRAARQGLSRLTEIRVLVLIGAVLAVTGALAAMIWQRRDLVAFIKCQGYSRATLWRWLLYECSVLLCAGCLIGMAFGLCGQLLISHALAIVTGFPIVFNVGPLVALFNFGLVAIAAVSIIAAAGFLVVRVPPRTVSPAY